MRKFIHLVSILAIALVLALVNTACSAKANKSDHLQRADRYFDSGDYDKAEIEYINVIRSDRDNVRALSRLGTIYSEQGRLNRAAPFIYRGHQLATNDLSLRMKLGLIYLADGKLKEARNQANFVLSKRPEDDEAPLLLAELARTPKEIEETRLLLQRVSQKTNTAALQVALGTLSFQQRDYKTAEDAFKKAKTLNPKSSVAYSALATLYWTQNDLQAEPAFKMAAELAPPRSHRRLQYAMFKMQSGDLPGAKLLLEKMVKETPDYLPAWMKLAELVASEKKFDEAEKYLARVISRDPENYDALRLSANIKMAKGDTETASADFERMSKIYGRDPRAYYRLALAYLANNEPAKAIVSLRESVKMDTNFPAAIVLLADLQIKNGELTSAINSLKQLIQQQPRVPQAQLLLAEAYRVQGNFNEALKVCRGLEQLTPRDPQVLVLEGNIFLQQKKNDEARKVFSKILDMDPGHLGAVEQLVNLDIADKQYATALQLAEKQMEKYPAQAGPWLLQAQIFLAQQDKTRAEAALRKAIELQPNSQAAYSALARLYVSSNQNEKALKDLEAALEKNPKNTEALMLIGMIHQQQNDYKAARDAYEKLLAIQPKAVSALNNLSYLYSERLGDLDKAYDLARRASDLNPNDPASADTFGWILYKKGQYSRALALIKDSAAKLADDPEVQFHLAMTHYMMGNGEPARTAFQRVLKLNKDFAGKEEVNRRLSLLAIDPKTAGKTERAALEKRFKEQPDDPIASERLIAIYRRDGDADKVVEVYQAALKANPNNVKALLGMAQIYSSRPQKTKEAFEFAKTAHKLAPDDPNVSGVLGRLAYQMGDYKGAFNLLNEAVRKQPDEPEGLYDFALASYSVGQISSAEANMRKALRVNPALSRANDAKRFLNLVSTDPSQASTVVNQAEQILKSEPDYVPALMVVAAAQKQKGDASAAKQTYEKVLSRYPEFAPAQKQLAILYSQDPAKDTRAYELARQARETFPDDPELAKALGIIMYRQGKDYSTAARLLAESATKRNGDAELLYYLGMAKYHVKPTDKAGTKAALQQALGLNLPANLAAEAKRVLAELK